MLNTKQYLIEFGISMALYAVAVIFSVSFLVKYPDSSWRIGIALLPILPSIMTTIAVIRALKRLDELQLKVQMTSLTISFAVVGLATFTYGFLENAGFPPIPYVWILPFMIATWGIATPIVGRAYQ